MSSDAGVKVGSAICVLEGDRLLSSAFTDADAAKKSQISLIQSAKREVHNRRVCFVEAAPVAADHR